MGGEEKEAFKVTTHLPPQQLLPSSEPPFSISRNKRRTRFAPTNKCQKRPNSCQKTPISRNRHRTRFAPTSKCTCSRSSKLRVNTLCASATCRTSSSLSAHRHCHWQRERERERERDHRHCHFALRVLSRIPYHHTTILHCACARYGESFQINSRCLSRALSLCEPPRQRMCKHHVHYKSSSS